MRRLCRSVLLGVSCTLATSLGNSRIGGLQLSCELVDRKKVGLAAAGGLEDFKSQCHRINIIIITPTRTTQHNDNMLQSALTRLTDTWATASECTISTCQNHRDLKRLLIQIFLSPEAEVSEYKEKPRPTSCSHIMNIIGLATAPTTNSLLHTL